MYDPIYGSIMTYDGDFRVHFMYWANVTALFDYCRELLEHCQKIQLQLFKWWITVSSRFKAVCFRTYISELYKPQFSKFTDAVVRGPRL